MLVKQDRHSNPWKMLLVLNVLTMSSDSLCGDVLYDWLITFGCIPSCNFVEFIEPISSSPSGTSTPYKFQVESEVMGPRPIGYM